MEKNNLINKEKPQYRFVVAYENEASGIIYYYKLKICDFKPNIFKCYKNKEQNIWLVITNRGNINMAAGVTYLRMISPENAKSIWINIGIAGHYNHKIGTIHNIKKVINSRNEKEVFYTNSIINDGINNAIAYNVEVEERNFKEKFYIYEMEALGFIKTTERFCVRELICILKIISDNKFRQPDDYIRTSINLIKKNIEKIDRILAKYFLLAKEIKNNDNKLIEVIENRFHLTFTNKVRMKVILSKVVALKNDHYVMQKIQESKNLKELFIILERIISEKRISV